jgi:carbon-monoxide dehydrogenase large subunit
VVFSRQVGARIKRKEDPRLLTGSSTYVDDFRPAGVGHVAFLRSVYGHATLDRVDTSRAAAHPGVLAVYTGRDFADLGPMPAVGEEEGPVADAVPIDTPVLPIDRVRHVGQAFAVVVATSRAIARDALDLIDVEYGPLPVVTDLQAAIREGAPQLHEEAPNNIAYTWTRVAGRPDEAFADAEVVVTRTMHNQRVAGNSMETRGVLAQPDPLSGGLVVITSTQTPHTVRRELAHCLGLSELDIRVIAPEVGGGFGIKVTAYQEEILCAAIALRLKRPVKWSETRGEHLLATHHGRGQVAEVSLAAQRDGTITAVRLRVLADLGAYPRAALIPTLTGRMMNGVYRFANVDLEIRGVYTNTMATGPYRGAGRPEAAYYVERIVDVLAGELGLDPVALRRKNFIPPDAFPYQTAAWHRYDSGDYEKPLAKALALADYDGLRAEQARLRKEGRYLGIGIATFTEVCAVGPYESALVRVAPGGQVTVATGASPHGQGTETTFAQIVADRLGVSMDDVVVVHGDTARTPPGIGTFGSRGLVVGGSALVMGLDQITAKIHQIVAHQLEAAAEDVTFADGKFGVKGSPEGALDLRAIARVAYSGSLPPAIGTGLEATDFFAPPGTTFPFGADVVTVEVAPDTGEIAIRDYVTVDDCGVVISPLLVDGQVHGGLAQGIGQALWEGVEYDADGQLVTGSLMDYAIPRAQDFPQFTLDRTETPSPLNPLGAKGIGELATIGSTPAIVNAVVDALSPFGITHLDMPLRPQRVWQAIQAAKTAPVAVD